MHPPPFSLQVSRHPLPTYLSRDSPSPPLHLTFPPHSKPKVYEERWAAAPHSNTFFFSRRRWQARQAEERRKEICCSVCASYRSREEGFTHRLCPASSLHILLTLVWNCCYVCVYMDQVIIINNYMID